MKKLVLLLALTAAFAACKKEEAAPVEEVPAATETAPVEEVPAEVPADAPPANP
jgi:hypothetical protein